MANRANASVRQLEDDLRSAALARRAEASLWERLAATVEVTGSAAAAPTPAAAPLPAQLRPTGGSNQVGGDVVRTLDPCPPALERQEVEAAHRAQISRQERHPVVAAGAGSAPARLRDPADAAGAGSAPAHRRARDMPAPAAHRTQISWQGRRPVAAAGAGSAPAHHGGPAAAAGAGSAPAHRWARGSANPRPEGTLVPAQPQEAGHGRSPMAAAGAGAAPAHHRGLAAAAGAGSAPAHSRPQILGPIADHRVDQDTHDGDGHSSGTHDDGEGGIDAVD